MSLTPTAAATGFSSLIVDLRGVLLFPRETLLHIYERGAGNVVNVSSEALSPSHGGTGASVSSKCSPERLTRVTTLEGETHGANANAIDPGGRKDTDIRVHLSNKERERILDPDVLDDATVLLAAQEPGGVTGESMTVDEWGRYIISGDDLPEVNQRERADCRVHVK